MAQLELELIKLFTMMRRWNSLTDALWPGLQLNLIGVTLRACMHAGYHSR